MVKEVIHDPILLAMKSEKATIEDLQVAEDLLDTLTANAAGCVGMAANMIGVHKRIICFDDNGKYIILVVKGDIMQKGNTYLETLKDNVRHELKDDEFKAEMSEVIKKVTHTEIKRATKPFKVDKLVYPQYQ